MLKKKDKVALSGLDPVTKKVLLRWAAAYKSKVEGEQAEARSREARLAIRKTTLADPVLSKLLPFQGEDGLNCKEQ